MKEPTAKGYASRAPGEEAEISVRDSRTGRVISVTSGGRGLVARERDGQIAWTVDAGAVGVDPDCTIRFLRLDDGLLWATCGKSETFTVAVQSGKARYEGSD